MLGPLLFIIYINEVAQLPLMADSKLAMYADNILLYRLLQLVLQLILSAYRRTLHHLVFGLILSIYASIHENARP